MNQVWHENRKLEVGGTPFLLLVWHLRIVWTFIAAWFCYNSPLLLSDASLGRGKQGLEAAQLDVSRSVLQRVAQGFADFIVENSKKEDRMGCNGEAWQMVALGRSFWKRMPADLFVLGWSFSFSIRKLYEPDMQNCPVQQCLPHLAQQSKGLDNRPNQASRWNWDAHPSDPFFQAGDLLRLA